jgi:phage terminase large subunit-like protein
MDDFERDIQILTEEQFEAKHGLTKKEHQSVEWFDTVWAKDNGIFFYDPHSKQEEFHRNQCAYRLLHWGNRVGKTHAGAAEAVYYACGIHPYKDVQTPNEGWIVSKDYNVQREAAQKIVLELLPKSAIKKIWHVKAGIIDIIELTNGSKIGFKSCLAASQRVQCADGISRPIADIKIGHSVISTDCWHRSKVSKVLDVWSNGVKPILKITTKRGHSIRVTKDHKIMTTSGWRQAKDLKIGDRLIAPEFSITGSKTLENWKLAWVALLIGDGCLTSKSAILSCENDLLIQEAKLLLPKGLKARLRSKHKKDYEITCKRGVGPNNNPLIQLLRGYGLWGKYSYEKFIPDEVFQQTDLDIRLFLGFLFATDGCISDSQISYSTTSYRLAQDVKLLLQRLGIRVCMQTIPGGKYRESYRVCLKQKEARQKFLSQVRVPGKAIASESASSYLSNYIPTNKKHKRCSNRYCKIVSIVDDGEEEVFDITVEKYHRFLADGLIVSNCDSGVTRFAGAAKRWIWFDEEPPREIWSECMARIAAGKDLDIWLTMTPIFEDNTGRRVGMTWAYKELYRRQDGKRIWCSGAGIKHNPYLSKVQKEEQMRKYHGAEYDIRINGEFKLLSGSMVFDADSVQYYLDNCKEYKKRGYLDKGVIVKDERGTLYVWDEPHPGTRYFIGSDVGLGSGGDPSCAVVFDQNLTQVAELHGQIPPDTLGKKLIDLGRYYNNAWIAVEANSFGIATLNEIKKLYSRLYYKYQVDQRSDIRTKKLGWWTDSKSKPLMISKFGKVLRERTAVLPSKELVEELMTYVIGEDGFSNAERGCHDDRVMAAMICYMGWERFHTYNEMQQMDKYLPSNKVTGY